MYLKQTSTLQESIIESLAARPQRTVEELRERCTRLLRPVSVQAIYKELRKLQVRGVVVKAGTRYSLTLSWVLRVLRLSDVLEKSYFIRKEGIIPIPQKGDSVRWRFSDLKRLDDFWVQAMLVLTKQSGTTAIYQWVPQPWFHLAQHQKELQFQQTAKTLGMRVFMILGGRNFLVRGFPKYWARDVYTYSLATGPFEHLRRVYLNIIGDFVLRITLDKRTAATIDQIFTTVRSVKDLRPSTIFDLFGQKASITVRLYHRPSMASSLRIRFERYFQSLKDRARND